MKKLMCAVAALAAGVTMAADGIASANIVGYQQKPVASGDAFSFIVNTFKPVDKDKADVTLGDMSFVGDNLTLTGTELQLFNENGRAVVRAYYANQKFADLYGVKVGWYDADVLDDDEEFVEISSTKIPYGTGMAVVCGNDGVSVSFNGEVLKGAQNIKIASDDAFTFTGNCLPVDGKQLKDFALTGDEQTLTGTELQLFNENGRATTRAYYANKKYADLYGIEVGWYDADTLDDEEEFVSIGTVSIPSAQGLAIVCGNDGVEFVVPQAIAE